MSKMYPPLRNDASTLEYMGLLDEFVASLERSEMFDTTCYNSVNTHDPAVGQVGDVAHLTATSTRCVTEQTRVESVETNSEHELRESLTFDANAIVNYMNNSRTKSKEVREWYRTGKFEMAKGYSKCATTCPLILFDMPMVSLSTASDETMGSYSIKVQKNMSRLHAQLLSTKLSPSWERHMELVSTQRNISIFDVWKDDVYVGGVILSRFWMREQSGILAPCVCVESIAVKQTKKGHGSNIFAWCKEALFLGVGPDIHHGTIFAQCLDTPFWNYELDVTNMARGLIFQMHTKFGNLYTPEPGCSMRAKIYQKKCM